MDEIINWLLEGDISIQYQVYRDLLSEDRNDLRERISKEGWGAKFLSCQNKDKHWGRKFYQPKWTSTHYTLLDLKNLNISPDTHLIKETVQMLLENEKGEDGGINPAGTVKESDVCLNGMLLNYAAYFKAEEEKLRSIIDFILSQRLDDGGFNCRFNRMGARHSSLHSTLSVAEGIREYILNGYTYRLYDLLEAETSSQEFILKHRLFISDRTGEIIQKQFLNLSYPSRWRYDILRTLDYFRLAKVPYEKRMQPAIDVLLKKRKNQIWKLQAKHPGRTHFEMEQPGKPSRWNTLRALRVLKYFGLYEM